MVIKNSTPAAVEGREIEIVSRNIRRSGVPRPTSGQDIVFPVSAKDNSTASIIREYSILQYKIRSYSMLCLGDEICGRSLWGFCDNPIGRIGVGGKHIRSGRHSNQTTTLSGNICFLEIVTDWQLTSLDVHPQDELLT